MDSNELARKMLAWGELQEQAAELEAEIKEAVLEIGKTQTVGNVRQRTATRAKLINRGMKP